MDALLDSGSTDKSFIDNNIVKSLKLKVYPESGSIGLATSAMSCKIIGYCVVDISLQNRNYEQHNSQLFYKTLLMLLIQWNLIQDKILILMISQYYYQ